MTVFLCRQGRNGHKQQRIYKTHRRYRRESHGSSHSKHGPVRISDSMPHPHYLIILVSAICGRDWKEKNPEGTKAKFDSYFKNLSADELRVSLCNSNDPRRTLIVIFLALQRRGEGQGQFSVAFLQSRVLTFISSRKSCLDRMARSRWYVFARWNGGIC